MAVKDELFGLNVPDPPAQTPVVVGPDTNPESVVDALFLQEIFKKHNY